MFERLPAFQAARDPEGVAIATTAHDYTFAELSIGSAKMAHLLRNSGVQSGQRVVVQVSHAFAHWIITFGLEALGAVSCALPQVADWKAAMAYLGADLLIIEQPLAEDPGVPCIIADQGWLAQIAEQPLDPVERPDRTAADPVRLVVTSGSTGLPKKIMLTRDVLDRRIGHAAISQVFANDKPRAMSPIGEGSIAGIMMALTAWTVGGALRQFDPQRSWAENLSGARVDGIAVAPIHLKLLLAGLPDDFAPMEGLAVFVAGGSLSKPLAEATVRRLSSNVIVGFGATETGSVTQGHLGLLRGAEDSAGFIQPWAEVEVLGPDEHLLPEGEIGEIRIRGVEVVDGYADEPASEQFKDGWFYPRDLGVIQAGVMRVVGRADELIHVGGAKILPGRLEEPLLDLAEVADAAAFGRQGKDGMIEPCVAITPSEGVGWIQLERLALARLTDLQARLRTDIRVFQVSEIPRNALGKVERHKLVQQLAGHV